MQLDITSALIILGSLSTLMGLWMLAASFALGETYAVEMRVWAVSSVLFGLTFVLFAARGSIPLL